MVSVMPSAVSGFTNHDAPSAAVVPAGSGMHSLTLSVRYCAYMAPPIIETVLPIRALAASDDPVWITTPAPSLPTGMDSSSRPAIALMAASGTLAVTTGESFVPETFAVERSAAPVKSPRSEGLIGVASTLTTTSSGFGSGVGTCKSEISSSPLFLISERSCRPLACWDATVKSLPSFFWLIGSDQLGALKWTDKGQDAVETQRGIPAARSDDQQIVRRQRRRDAGECDGGIVSERDDRIVPHDRDRQMRQIRRERRTDLENIMACGLAGLEMIDGNVACS